MKKFLIGIAVIFIGVIVFGNHIIAQKAEYFTAHKSEILNTIKQHIAAKRWGDAGKLYDEYHSIKDADFIAMVAPIVDRRQLAEFQELAVQTLAKRCGEKGEVRAFVMAQQFVKQRLKAPASAEFPYFYAKGVQRYEDCTFVVGSYVDAQNSFGAKLRKKFVVKLRRAGSGEDGWTLLDLVML